MYVLVPQVETGWDDVEDDGEDEGSGVSWVEQAKLMAVEEAAKLEYVPLHPKSYTPYLTPCSLLPTPYSLLPTPYFPTSLFTSEREACERVSERVRQKWKECARAREKERTVAREVLTSHMCRVHEAHD
jgi:hypothetical protein